MAIKQQVQVVGHRNPDTDSICAAIAYAALKNQTGDGSIQYIPRRAGAINEETRFVLNYFHVEQPALLEDVKTQIQDIEIQAIPGANRDISLKKAWDMMKAEKVETLPVLTEDGQLEGVITIGDIAKSYMDLSESGTGRHLRTKFKNILETIGAQLLWGNSHSYFLQGNVVLLWEEGEELNSLQKEDIAIVGGNSQIQKLVLKKKVCGMIICQKKPVDEEVLQLAKANECQLLLTRQEPYQVVRQLEQSMPIRHFMSKKGLDTFWLEDTIDSIRDTVATERRRDFPVLDGKGRYCGMLSRRNLLNLRRKQIVLVDHNERTQAIEGIEEAHILEIIDHHRLGNLETLSPLYFRNQPVGCTSTIIYEMYQEKGLEPEPQIAGLMCSAILSDTLMFRSPTCTEKDVQAGEALGKIAGIETIAYGEQMFRAGSNLSGKSGKEIFYQDFKTFMVGKIHFGVGQISSMNAQELEEVKELLLPQMETEFQEKKLDMLFLMLTNIRMESTELLCMGDQAESVMRDSFQVELEEGSCELQGVVSRKKQLIPAMLSVLQA